MIESDGKTAVFIADLMPTAAHLPLAVDHGLRPLPDGHARLQARVHRRGGRANEYLILFEHDPEIAAGYMRRRDGRIVIERVL